MANTTDGSSITANAASRAEPTGNDTGTGPASVAGDLELCRICRGEGTPGEPLFYPCKCSGTIKYVHQDCLMEWLSHSQKKHCVLCRTPFRFTKLYSPNMPKRLPFHVFASYMTKYLFRNILIWLRGALVATVWLGWLPYLMRSVWSFLFWISDEGFGPPQHLLLGGSQNTTAAHMNAMAATVTRQGLTTTTCPSSPLLAASISPIMSPGLIEQLPNVLRALASPKSDDPQSTSLPASLVRLLFGSPASSPNKLGNVSSNSTQVVKLALSAPTSNRYGSLLSEVPFLRNMTNHTSLNRILISVLEGQIITVLVIVAFILIILVRDYVVQQQPEINMRAAFAAQIDQPAERPREPVEGQRPPDPLQPPAVPALAPDNVIDSDSDEDRDDDAAAQDDDSVRAHHEQNVHLRDEDETSVEEERAASIQDPRQRPIADFTRRLARRDTFNDDNATHLNQPDQNNQFTTESTRDALEDLARNIRRDSEDPPQTTVNQYLRIYREASGDREKILRIIHEQGLEDRLAYWVRLTQQPVVKSRGDSPEQAETQNEVVPSQGLATSGILDEDGVFLSSDPRNSRQTLGGFDNVQESAQKRQEGTSERPQSKGKGRATSPVTNESSGSATDTHGSDLTWEGESDTATVSVPDPSSSLLRPRAVSDGPQRHDTINLLANNSWSFAGLPPSTDLPENLPGESIDGPASSPSLSFDSARIGKDEDTDDQLRRREGSIPGNDDHHIGNTLAFNQTDAHVYLPDHTPHLTPPLEGPTAVPFAPLDDEHEPVAAVRQQPTMVDRVANFMWRGIDAGGENGPLPDAVELFIDDENAPFAEANRGGIDAENAHDDIEDDDDDDVMGDGFAPDVVEAAAAAGIDPEAVEDAEDFDGIMELVGMRGPIAGLFQNTIFCAFLVSFTIFLGVFMPYNIGRLAVWVAANPIRIVRMVLSFSRFVQDLCLFAVGWTSTFILDLLYLFSRIFRVEEARGFLTTASTNSRHLTSESLGRLWDGIISETAFISSNEIRNFSVVSHEALLTVKEQIRTLLAAAVRIVVFVCGGDYLNKWTAAKAVTLDSLPILLNSAKNATAGIARTNAWTISLRLPETVSSFDPALAYWSAKDRTLAILSGYLSLSLLAGLYLGRGTPFSSGRTAQEWEASFIDGLNQASGVMKVILIISIEMLVFPLYCGLLLDFALLPLFESTSFKSRLLFTYNFPLTSIFVHWFVGTGYMFHFALFVSMCRKIMRKGVLYFIRDPDDPEFHPVRDVLERSVTTQLRKIMFSAFVYGALVIVCLGGVVWGLALVLPHVLPIHYSSNEPVLEFPIDLLFYNFLMPLAIKFFKPSDGLHAMYTWWFRRCARILRLTWFLFGERQIDEEGILHLAPDSPYEAYPWYRKLLLEVNKTNQVTPKSWIGALQDQNTKPTTKLQPEALLYLAWAKNKLVDTGQLVPDGRFVRTPASDQVKIPKGQPVFLDVSERNVRADGSSDEADEDIYSSTNYQLVYIAPRFRLRIFLFITFIWLFAAFTGVGITIIPLVFGRRMFKLLIPAHIRTNDIYAFSIGVYILGSLGYAIVYARSLTTKARQWLTDSINSLLDRANVDRALVVVQRGLKLAYTYTVLLVVFPLLVTLIMELYILMPLHTWKHSHVVDPSRALLAHGRFTPLTSRHTIRVIQAWTLGILYLKLGSRALILVGGRPAQAVRAVLLQGWMRPDVGVLTRAFVIPGLFLSAILIIIPPVFAEVIIKNGLVTDHWPHGWDVFIFRMSYPVAALFWSVIWFLLGILTVLDRWRARVRDEAYLMGERLHNFGGIVGTRGTASSARGDWRGGTRL